MSYLKLVDQIKGFGITVMKGNANQKCWTSDESYGKGGFVSPGVYTVELSHPFHSNLSGIEDDDRLEQIEQTQEPLIAKVINKQYGQFGFLSDSYSVPTDYKFSSIGTVITDTVILDIEGDVYEEENYQISPGTQFNLSHGDVLHIGFSKNNNTSWRGSEGIVIHCVDSVPYFRGLPWGISEGGHDISLWKSFVDKCWEVAPFIDHSNEYSAGFDSSTLTTDYLMDGSYDHTQLQNITDKLFNSAIYYRKTYDTGSTYDTSTLDNISKAFRFCLNTPQLGWGDWGEAITKNNWAAHGVVKFSPNRILSIIKLLFVAAIFKHAADLGYDVSPSSTSPYSIGYEPLYSKATIGQALQGYMPNRTCYGKDNFGVSSLKDASGASVTAAYYVSGVGIEAGGSGSVGSYEKMWSRSESRTSTFALMAWLCKLLDIPFSSDIKKALYLPQSGQSFQNAWGMTGSYWGHAFDPSGVFGCWDDVYNSYMARSMQWLWFLGGFDDTSMLRYATKNPHFYDQSWQDISTGNTSTSLNSVYTMKTFMQEPSVSASLAGDDVTLNWNIISAPSGGGAVTYNLYKIEGLKWGYELSSEVGAQNIIVPATAQVYDKEYGSYMADRFTLVASGISDTSTVYELSGGEGTYHFSVKATCTVSGDGDLSANTLTARSVYSNPVEVVATSQLRYSQSNSYTDADSGIKWSFDKSYKLGTFADGSPWVVSDGSTVTVTSVTPSGVVGILNPVPSGTQPFDSRDDTYASGSETYPLVLSAMDSLVCGKPKGSTQYTVDYFYGAKSTKVLLEDMAILTVLSAEPEATAFRPSPYGDPSQKAMYHTSGLVTSSLGNLSSNNSLTVPELYSAAFEDLLVSGSSATTAQRLARAIKKPYLWMLSGDSGEYLRPSKNQPSDRSLIESIFTDTMLVLHSSDREDELLHAFVQQGIDMLGAVDAAGSGYVPNNAISRAALLLNSYLLDKTKQVAHSLQTNYVNSLYWVDTLDPRIAKDTSAGLMYTSGLVGAGEDSYTWHYEPIGWTSDTQVSTTYFEHLSPFNWFSDQDYNYFTYEQDRYKNSINIVAEALGALCIQDTQDNILSGYGHSLAMYYADQWSHRPFDTSTPNYITLLTASQNFGVVTPAPQGDFGTAYARSFWSDHKDTLFDSRIKVHGHYLLNQSYMPAKGYARNYLPTFTQKYGGNHTITSPGVYEGFRSDRPINIQSDNVTVRNFSIGARRIANCIRADFLKPNGYAYENIVIEDGWCGGARGAAIVGSNIHVKNVTISNVEDDAIRIKDNCIIERCYIDNIGMSLSSTAVGIYSVGGKGCVVKENFVNLPYPQTDPYAAQHCVWFRSRNYDLSNYVLRDNWLVGSDSHTIRIGQAPLTSAAVSGTVTVERNRIGLATNGDAWNITIPAEFESIDNNHWWDSNTYSVSTDEITDVDPGTGTPGPV